MTTVRLFVPTSFEGVTSAAILRELLIPEVELDVQYVKTLDFRNYQQFKGAEVTVVLGLAYMGYNLPEEFYVEVDVPFQDFFHGATFGHPVNGNHIVSLVDEDRDPMYVLYKYLRLHPESSILGDKLQFTADTDRMVEAVNAYRTWTWDNNSTTKVLLPLYQAFYKYMPRMIRGKSLQEIVKEYAPIIKGQMDKMNDQLAKKAETAKRYDVTMGGVTGILIVVYADEYINELANYLLNSVNTFAPVVVCVGRATKGNDMFSIRTKNVYAGRIADMINGGSGKENVASVFVDVRYAELLGNTIARILSEYTAD